MTAEKSYLCPLFWQHHEDKEILRRELRQMKENGIGGFIAESRPHPDYLGSGWWEDMEILVQEAKRLGLKTVSYTHLFRAVYGNGTRGWAWDEISVGKRFF